MSLIITFLFLVAIENNIRLVETKLIPNTKITFEFYAVDMQVKHDKKHAKLLKCLDFLGHESFSQHQTPSYTHMRHVTNLLI